MTAQTAFFSVALPVPLRTSFDYKGPAQTGIGFRVKVPFGNRTMIGVVVRKTDKPSIDEDKIKDIHATIDDTPCVPQELLDLCIWASQYYHHPIGEVIFSALPQRYRQGDTLPKELVYTLTTEGKGLPETALARAKKQQQCFHYLLKNRFASTEDLKEQGVSSTILNTLSSKGIIELTSPPSSFPVNNENNNTVLLREEPQILNPQQENALNQFRYHDFNCYLLEGITGSGKTEVYLHITERVLRSDRQVLILIPEIGLSSQTVERFRKRFDAHIVELHSNVSDLKRAKNWEEAKEGKAKIIIGTRLAALTPFKNLGVVIIDEEHDLSYKQQDGFKYSARDLSIVRAQKNNIPILLGSATPSLESLNNAIQGKFEHLRITQRAGGAIPPKLTIEDLKGKNIIGGLSDDSLHQIHAHLSEQNQVLIFLNRRGYAPSLLCHKCGWSAACRYCDAKMTVHTRPPHLHCHHCGNQGPLYKKCPSCQSTGLSHQGLGTEQTEEAITNSFPNTQVLRIDRDSTQVKSAFSNMLAKVKEGKPCILVGTQMLAKGHHLPKVSLVVIVDADQGLMSPDFRGTERLGQQIIQVAGRAGRSNTQGSVIIQSHAPDHPNLELLLQKGYHRFARKLLEERKQSKTPPFWSLSIFRAESKRPENAIEFLELALKILRHCADTSNEVSTNEIIILGPLPSFMERVKDRFRYQVQVTTRTKGQMNRLLSRTLAEIDQHALSKRTRWSLDVDAQET